MKERLIFHIDCNNAFLSWTAVNMLHNGSKIDIRKRYAVIGGKESERKGIVLAKSNLCKKNGVITGETLYSARKKCPYLDVYQPQFNIYRKYSDIMYSYLCTYSKEIERYSIDECFIDFTNNKTILNNPIKWAYKIKDDIKNNFGFTVNIGIGNNKLLAKMASDFSKPDKVHTLYTNEIKEKMWPLKVEELFMIGKSSAKKLHDLKINTIKDLANCNIDFLIKHFKSMGKKMNEYANGIDYSPVESDYGNPKSISHSTVLPYNYSNTEEIYQEIKKLSTQTGKKLREKKMYASSVFVWVKFNDFTKSSKQCTLDNLISTDNEIYENAIKLLDSLWTNTSEKKIRALCVGINNLTDIYKVQLSIFENNQNHPNNNKDLEDVLNNIKEKYGSEAITYANKIQ